MNCSNNATGVNRGVCMNSSRVGLSRTMSFLRLPIALAIVSLADPTRAQPAASSNPAPSSEASSGTVSAGALGAEIDRWLRAADFRGNLLLAKNGVILFRKGYGRSDRENDVLYDVATVFSIGSITKQFTAAAILKLEMQGKLQVEDTLVKHLSGVPADKSGITLHHLLTHTSGLESDFANDFDAVGRDEYVRRILASKLRSKPGETYFYANSGYSLLGAIIETVSGKPYELFLRENLFLPAGMKETGYRQPKWDVRRIAVGYKDGKRWGRLMDKPWAEDGPYWALRANGGIHSTLDDLLSWHAALRGETVLSAAEKAKMYAPHVREQAGGDSSYGYGWSITDIPEAGRLVRHNGGNGVFYADFLRFLDEDLVVILSTNDSTVRGGRIAEAVARLAHGQQVPTPAPSNGPLKELATTGRDAVIRAWIDAFNAPDLAMMRAFRVAHATQHPGLNEAEREQRFKQMRENLGRLQAEGVLQNTDETVTVRAKASKGSVTILEFMFSGDGKLNGVGVQIGD
jgi:CubicO group peptidase (beta-lactamase class C family)